jgi:hypothetical protein
MATAAKARSTTGSTTKKATTPEAAPSRPSILGSIFGGSLGGNTAQGAARPKSPGMGRFFLGMMIYLFVSYVMQIVLLLLDAKTFHGKLTSTVLFKLPIFGNVNIMALIFMVVLVAVLWGLYKFKILPSNADLRAQGQALAVQNAAKKGGSTASLKNGSSAKNAITGKSSMTTKSATSRTTGTAKPTSTGKAAVASTNAAVMESSENDDLYAQVRAQRLSQARKARKH